MFYVLFTRRERPTRQKQRAVTLFSFYIEEKRNYVSVEAEHKLTSGKLFKKKKKTENRL